MSLPEARDMIFHYHYFSLYEGKKAAWPLIYEEEEAVKWRQRLHRGNESYFVLLFIYLYPRKETMLFHIKAMSELPSLLASQGDLFYFYFP